jgi:hypothetical protein
VTSLALAAVAASKARQVEKAAKSGQLFDPAVETAGKNASSGAIVTGLLGVAAGVTGAIWLMSIRSGEGSAEPSAAPSAAAGPAIFPIVGPGLAGAGASFSF